MTPFGEHLGTLRRTRRLKQRQLAGLLEVSPCYISALETGAKPPPSKEVLDRLIAAMSLTKEEERAFWRAVELSSLTIQVSKDLSQEEYEFLDQLRACLGSLCVEQLAIMQGALNLTGKLAMTGRNDLAHI